MVILPLQSWVTKQSRVLDVALTPVLAAIWAIRHTELTAHRLAEEHRSTVTPVRAYQDIAKAHRAPQGESLQP